MNVDFYSVLLFLCFGLISGEDQLLKEIQELKNGQKEIKSLLVEVFLELNRTDRTVAESAMPLVTANERFITKELDLIKSQLQALETEMKEMKARNADMTAKYNTLLSTNNNGM
uniref:Uncharacterized protein LOC111107510 n=1 Tax=Crassostrea virginica TaxID=6565 RepID=A0A8B8B4V2_CRAVI|nr:uncharacterized protein LOC111107510 [Crassostrea virginica]